MRSTVLPALLLILAGGAGAHAGGREESGAPAAPTRWLVLAAVDVRGRTPFAPDVAFRRHLLETDRPPPVEGGLVRGASGREARWTAVTADERGRVAGGAWAYATFEVEAAGVWMAELRGAATLYVNGVPFVGDAYDQGLIQTPVPLWAGTNHLYVTGARGWFRLAFAAPPGPVYLAPWDATLPDAVPPEDPAGSTGDLAGVVVVNASAEGAPESSLAALLSGSGGPPVVSDVLPLPPLSVRKEAIPFGPLRGTGVPVTLEAGLVRPGGPNDAFGTAAWSLALRGRGSARRITFASAIDGSVQFLGLLPALGERPGVVLTLHGAGVDAYEQAAAYAPKKDFVVAAPTNRRPFGFDWQDWGRQDAYEALDLVVRRYGIDRRNVHLTGHSMGGHGAWHLAANDPDGFASVAPSAGWISFDSYGGRPGGPLSRLWRAADAASETEELIENLASLPVYVLHGAADDNVPVGEARRMAALLAEHGARVEVHVEEGAGHWWDTDPAPGAACVDWPGFFTMFRANRIPADPPEIAFTTVDPGVDSRHHWVTVVQPRQYGSGLHVRARREEGAITVTTRNVHRLALAAAPPPERVVIDGEPLAWSPAGYVRGPRAWDAAPGPPPADEKRPGRTGPFKRAFDRRFVLVYGTAGTAAESAALLARARRDAQTWQYRANGRALLVSDRQFLAGVPGGGDRNVILYGNADTNAAWTAVVRDDCPIVPRRGRVAVGARTFTGDDLAVLFVHPRRGSDDALAGVVGDSGVVGTRLGFASAYFVSGVGYPDFVVYGPEALERGDEGVRLAGFFDRTWRVASD